MSSLVAVSALLASVSAPSEATAETYTFHLDHVLGTSFDLAVEAGTRAEAEFAFAAATGEINRLDRVLSGWRDDSELSALNRGAERQVSPDLYAVLSACESWRAKTGGAFSARLGAAESLASSDAICAAVARAEAADVGLDKATRTVSRPADVTFAVDGLAKGYVIDAAMTAARRAAPCARAMMLDVGGDIACYGDRDWSVGVADPANLADNAPPIEVIRVANRALAVSGPGMRDRLVDGVARSHLTDPATGAAAPTRQAAVLAANAATADALSTALSVMPRDAGLALAESMPGIEAMLIEDGQAWKTSGWNACQAAAPLPAGFTVDVSYTVPKIEAANYKKPFVIVWVTDLEKNPIKTLLISGTRQDWQEDNYVWWRRVGRKQPGVVEAMGKPTRAPGKYSVGWDGTDADGKRVAQGKYLINVEAAREHGGHAYQAIEVTLGTAAANAAAPGKDELGATAIRYGKTK